MRKRFWNLSVMWLLIAGLLVPTTQATPTISEGVIEVVELLPARGERARREALERLTAELGQVPALTRPDPHLIELLRWSWPDPEREACLDPAQLEALLSRAQAPEAGSPLSIFNGLVQSAAAFNNQHMAGEARAILQQARQLLPCVSELMPRERLTAFLREEVRATVALGEQASVKALISLSRLDADVQGPTAGLSLVAAPGHPLDLEGDPSQLFINAEPARAGMQLGPGWHLIQLRGITGDVRTRLVGVPEGAQPLRLSQLVGDALPSEEATLESLTRNVRNERLTPAQYNAINRYLWERQRPRLVFAVEPRTGDDPMARAFVAGQGLQSVSISRGGAAGGETTLLVDLSFGRGRTWSWAENWGQPGTGGQIRVSRVVRGPVSVGGLAALYGEGAADVCDEERIQQRFGAFLAYELPLSPRISLRSMAGVSGGDGLVWAVSCRPDEERPGQRICVPSSQAQSNEDIIPTSLHTIGLGPMAALRLTYGRNTRGVSWGITADGGVHSNLLNFFSDRGTAQLVVGPGQEQPVGGTSFRFTMGNDPDGEPYRIPLSIRFELQLGLSISL